VNWGTLIVAALTFLTALLTYLSSRSNKQSISKVDTKVDGVRTLVDGNHHDLVDRVSQLTGTLNDANVDVPAPPSSPSEPTPA
jgi:hypothetical protein